MPNTNAKRLIDGTLLTNSAVALYTAPANTKAVIKQLSVVNTAGTVHTVTIYIGSAADAAHAVWDAQPVPPTATAQASALSCSQAFNQVVESGQSIWALADTGAVVSLSCSGYELN